MWTEELLSTSRDLLWHKLLESAVKVAWSGYTNHATVVRHVVSSASRGRGTPTREAMTSRDLKSCYVITGPRGYPRYYVFVTAFCDVLSLETRFVKIGIHKITYQRHVFCLSTP